jgi:hypothetical protein
MAGEMTEMDLRLRFLTALTAASSNLAAADSDADSALGVEVNFVGVRVSSRRGRPRPRPFANFIKTFFILRQEA